MVYSERETRGGCIEGVQQFLKEEVRERSMVYRYEQAEFARACESLGRNSVRLLSVFERKEVSRASTERKYLESFSGGEQVYALQCEGRICCVLHALLVALFFQSQRCDINEQFDDSKLLQ